MSRLGQRMRGRREEERIYRVIIDEIGTGGVGGQDEDDEGRVSSCGNVGRDAHPIAPRIN